MKLVGKAPGILPWIISGVLLCSVTIFYLMKENERTEKTAYQRQFQKLSAVKKDLEAKLEETKTQLQAQAETIEASAKSLEKESAEKASIAKKFDELKMENNQLTQKLSDIQLTISSFRAKLDDERNIKERLLGDLEKANNECLDLKMQLNRASAAKEEADKKLNILSEKNGVSLGTIFANQKS